MTGVAQLRHALAHELGHRWQLKAKAQLAALWSGVPAIRDPKRYGYDDRSEHQAEAVAFAVNFLQTTATTRPAIAASSLSLLDHYELLVPGTTTIADTFSCNRCIAAIHCGPFSPPADSPTLREAASAASRTRCRCPGVSISRAITFFTSRATKVYPRGS